MTSQKENFNLFLNCFKNSNDLLNNTFSMQATHLKVKRGIHLGNSKDQEELSHL